MAFKPSYNIMDRDTHNALVNAFKTGGIGYTDDDGTVHKISEDYAGEGGGGSDDNFSNYDIVLQLNSVEGDITSITAMKGTLAEIKEKIESGKFIYPFVYISDDNGYTTTCISEASWCLSDGELADFFIDSIGAISSKVISSNHVVGAYVLHIIFDGEEWIID